MKVESYSIASPAKGLSKQHVILANEGCTGAPLVYLQRPKWIADDAQWLAIVASIRLELPAGFEVGGL
jgi:hypothetical protein